LIRGWGLVCVKMKWDWRRAASHASFRIDHRNILAGLSILAMYMTGTFHPSAGINPLLVVSNNLPWSFLLAPVLAGALLLAAFAYVWHRWLRRQSWPQHWLQRRHGVVARWPPSFSANCSPSRTSTALRWWNACSVERCPIETMAVPGNFSLSKR